MDAKKHAQAKIPISQSGSPSAVAAELPWISPGHLASKDMTPHGFAANTEGLLHWNNLKSDDHIVIEMLEIQLLMMIVEIMIPFESRPQWAFSTPAGFWGSEVSSEPLARYRKPHQKSDLRSPTTHRNSFNSYGA